METAAIIIFIIIMGIGLTVFEAGKDLEIQNAKRGVIEKLKTALSMVDGFSATQKLWSSDLKNGIAIDEDNSKICLIRRFGGISTNVINYSDILSSEIIEDGDSISQTSRKSQLGGALLGGLLLGGVGAIIGGLSGKTISSKKIKKLSIRLTINNMKNPIHDIVLINKETLKKDLPYRSRIKVARRWHSLICIIIKRADELDAEKEFNKPYAISESKDIDSVADELEKLGALKDKGILTEAEFSAQKEKLLN